MRLLQKLGLKKKEDDLKIPEKLPHLPHLDDEGHIAEHSSPAGENNASNDEEKYDAPSQIPGTRQKHTPSAGNEQEKQQQDKRESREKHPQKKADEEISRYLGLSANSDVMDVLKKHNRRAESKLAVWKSRVMRKSLDKLNRLEEEWRALQGEVEEKTMRMEMLEDDIKKEAQNIVRKLGMIEKYGDDNMRQ